jgi:FkbM family methyltransferase
MVSYAQNGEDVVLRRVFADVAEGFYVDVGACVPVEDSVTCFFYERGWRGVNVEPDPAFFAELDRARPRDVNVLSAVGPGASSLTFHRTGVRGQGTVLADVAADREPGETLQVGQVSLSALLEQHAPASGVEFLKVDVEGWEAEVLSSHDWKEVRPKVVVVEAVDGRGTPNHQGWEPALLTAGYVLGLFDGLNRFYCAAEHAEQLLPRMTAPANVLDSFRVHREVLIQQHLDEQLAVARTQNDALQSALDAERDGRAALERQQEDVQARLEQVGEALDAERAAAAELRRELSELRRAWAATQSALDASEAELVALRAEVEGLRSSTSWRMTAPVRDVSRFLKVVLPGRSTP